MPSVNENERNADNQQESASRDQTELVDVHIRKSTTCIESKVVIRTVGMCQ